MSKNFNGRTIVCSTCLRTEIRSYICENFAKSYIEAVYMYRHCDNEGTGPIY